MKRKKSNSRSSLEQKIAEGRRKLQEAYNAPAAALTGKYRLPASNWTG